MNGADDDELAADFVIIGGGLGGCAAALAKANPRLNPGNCWVSRIGCEPRVALTVIEAMLAPYVASGQLRILCDHAAVAADVHRERVQTVRVRHRDSAHDVVLRAPYFADATELGDLLPLTRTECGMGAESTAQTGEPHAKRDAEADNVQAFTMCFALEHRSGVTYRVLGFDEPANQRIGFDPEKRTGYWSYGGVIDRDLIAPQPTVDARCRHDVSLVSRELNDYSFGSVMDVETATAQQHVARARMQSRSLQYWLQTEAPRPNGGAGWPGLRLRPEKIGSDDVFAKYPYIRESRRTPKRHARRRVFRQRGDRPLRRHPALSDSARRAAAEARGQTVAGVQEPRRHACHQRLLPAASDRMEHR